MRAFFPALILIGFVACGGQVDLGTPTMSDDMGDAPGSGGALTNGDTAVGGSPGTGGATSGSDGAGLEAGAGGSAGTDETGGDPFAGDAGDPLPLPCPKPAGEICHEFLASDNGHNVVVYVNEFDPTRNWTSGKVGSGANSPRTIEVVESAAAKRGKAVLVSTNTGYMELDLVDGKSLHTIVGFSNVSGACRLPGGETLLALVSKFTFVNAAGQELKTISPPGSDGGGLRSIRRNPADKHIWYSSGTTIYETTEAGVELWNLRTPANVPLWREGGGAYGSTDDHLVEVDATGNVLGEIGGRDKFHDLDFVSGFERLTNGHFVITNWLGHLTPAPDSPQVLELTPANELAWKWGNQTVARQLTWVHVIR
jgi:hypothetical protein